MTIVVGGIFVPGTASAGAVPQCLRHAEPSGPCAQKVAIPSTFPAKKPHGMILIINGGAWQGSNPNTSGGFYQAAFDRWLGRGYVVAMIEHSDGLGVAPNKPTGLDGYINVLQWYDLYRSFWDNQPGYGRNFPICAIGFSSGGHFALMLGAHRPTLDCIVAEGPPTRLDYVARPGVATHAPGLLQWVQDVADLTFSGVLGVSPDPAWSPLYQRAKLGHLKMPILVGHANNDTLVSPNQTRTFCPRIAKSNCRAEYLAPGRGGVPDFTHGDVKDQDLLIFRKTERAWVCAVVSKVTGPCS